MVRSSEVGDATDALVTRLVVGVHGPPLNHRSGSSPSLILDLTLEGVKTTTSRLIGPDIETLVMDCLGLYSCPFASE
jgi:hypothetical protein